MDPDRIYFNVTAAAGVVTTTFAVAPLAYYQEQRDPPLVQHQEDFELAVERFSITGVKSLPVYIPPIIPDVDNPSNPFKTALAFTLSAAAAPGAAVQTPVPGTYSLRVGIFPPDGSNFDNIITFSSAATTLAGFVTALQNGLDAVLGPSILNVAPTAQSGTAILWTNSSSPLLNFRVGPATDALVSTAPFGFAPVSAGTDPAESNLVSQFISSGVIGVESPLKAWYTTAPGASVTQYVQWQPQSYGYPPPRAPGPDVDIAANPLYWCFDYDWFATVLNAAFVSAAEQLLSQLPASQDYMPPFVLYDNASARFVLYSDANYTPYFRRTDAGSPGYPILISLNEPLQNLLLLPAVYDTEGNAEVSWNQSPRVNPPGFTDATPKWVSATPNYSSVGSGWSPIQSIVFVSSRISVRNEAVSLPTVFGETDSGFGGIATFTQTTQQQITDIVPNITDAMQWIAQSTIYQPSVLRYIDVLGVGPLNKIDFQVFWKHRITGVCYPLSLNPLAAFEAKVMLKKKGVLSCF